MVLPASFLGAAFLTAFLLCFLVFGASTLLPLAGGLAGVCAGAWAANIIGTEATAKTTAIIVFFISFSPLRALPPAHNSMFRQMAKFLDSLQRLFGEPNWEVLRLRRC